MPVNSAAADVAPDGFIRKVYRFPLSHTSWYSYCISCLWLGLALFAAKSL